MVASDAATNEETMPAGYPSAWEFDGLLRNGETAVVRPIRPSEMRRRWSDCIKP